MRQGEGRKMAGREREGGREIGLRKGREGRGREGEGGRDRRREGKGDGKSTRG